jgi:hypothetical protein
VSWWYLQTCLARLVAILGETVACLRDAFLYRLAATISSAPGLEATGFDIDNTDCLGACWLGSSSPYKSPMI